MKCRGWEQLKANRKNGISMVLVTCVAAFFIAFAAAILYTAGLLTAQSNQRLKEERCYQLSKSFSEALGKELKKYDQKKDTSATGTIYAYANKFLDGERYLEYDDNYPDSTKYNYVINSADLNDLTKSGSLPDEYGNLVVTLKKEKNANESVDSLKGGTIENPGDGNYDTIIAEIENTSVREYLFIVDVTAYYEDATYTYSTEYNREEKYKIRFSHNGTEIVWDSDARAWKVGNTSGAVYDFNNSEDPITYEYIKSETTQCKYVENTYAEEGSGDAGQ